MIEPGDMKLRNASSGHKWWLLDTPNF